MNYLKKDEVQHEMDQFLLAKQLGQQLKHSGDDSDFSVDHNDSSSLIKAVGDGSDSNKDKGEPFADLMQ